MKVITSGRGDLDAYFRLSLHAVTLWLFTALASWELTWAVSHTVGSSGSWSITAWAILPAVILALLPSAALRIRWPLQVRREAYLPVASAGFAFYLGCWSFATNVLVSSPSAPLPYVP